MEGTDRHISLAEAAERLGVHYMTAYRYVRTGRLPARKVGSEWRVDPADLPDPSAAPRPAPGGRGRRRDRTDDLVERLIRSDEPGSWAIVEASLGGGMEPDEVYVDLLGPALRTIGDRWAAGEVSVAEEHQASAIVARLVGRLGPRFVRRGRARGTVVLGAAPGDAHGLPSALVADLVRQRRFNVVDLGGDVPIESWRSACASTPRLLAVGICASTGGADDALRAAVEAVRSVTDAPIVLGGHAVRDEAHARAIGASAASTSTADAVAQIEALATSKPAPAQPPT